MQSTSTDLGVFILRLAQGIMFLSHGLLKLFVFTLPGTAGFFASVGYPSWLAYVVVPAEVLSGIALLVGFQTRWVALAGIPILLGALAVHLGNGWLFSSANGGWEYPLYLVVISVVLVIAGGGRYSVSSVKKA